MSIFQFFEIIFFCRTEKSGYIFVIIYCSIISKDFINIFSKIFRVFWNSGFKRSDFWTFLTHKPYELTHKNYAATIFTNIFVTLLLLLVRWTFIKYFLSADSKRLISLMSQIVSQNS